MSTVTNTDQDFLQGICLARTKMWKEKICQKKCSQTSENHRVKKEIQLKTFKKYIAWQFCVQQANFCTDWTIYRGRVSPLLSLLETQHRPYPCQLSHFAYYADFTRHNPKTTTPPLQNQYND